MLKSGIEPRTSRPRKMSQEAPRSTQKQPNRPPNTFAIPSSAARSGKQMPKRAQDDAGRMEITAPGSISMPKGQGCAYLSCHLLYNSRIVSRWAHERVCVYACGEINSPSRTYWENSVSALSHWVYIYIYIYMCFCVCVHLCVCAYKHLHLWPRRSCCLARPRSL